MIQGANDIHTLCASRTLKTRKSPDGLSSVRLCTELHAGLNSEQGGAQTIMPLWMSLFPAEFMEMRKYNYTFGYLTSKPAWKKNPLKFTSKFPQPHWQEAFKSSLCAYVVLPCELDVITDGTVPMVFPDLCHLSASPKHVNAVPYALTDLLSPGHPINQFWMMIFRPVPPAYTTL